MNMKISDPNARLMSTAASAPVAGVAVDARSKNRAAAIAQSDHIQLSQLSEHLDPSNSPAHLQKLAQLEGAVSSGSYQVDAGVVSNAVIQYALQYGAV